jgi:hypothetical protein
MTRFYILTTLITFVCFGQIRNNYKQNDLRQNKLRGKVKELSYFEFGVVNSKTDSTYLLYPSGYYSDDNCYLEFNEKGYIEKKTIYTPGLEPFEVDKVCVYFRDEKNKIITQHQITYPEKDTIKINYKSDEKIPGIKKYRIKLKLDYKYTYDSNNNWIEKKRFYKGKLEKVYNRKITYY